MSSDERKTTFWSILRAAFGSGLVVIIPAGITYWVLSGLFETIDHILSPLFERVIGYRIPGLGFATMVVLILVIGFLSRNLIGKALFAFLEKIIGSIPLARTIYSAMKDLLGAFQMGGDGKSFRQVVLIEYPRLGMYAIGFVTNEIKLHSASASTDVVSIYIPSPPNPTAGNLVLVPTNEVQVLDLSVEDGLKLVISGGIVSTGALKTK